MSAFLDIRRLVFAAVAPFFLVVAFGCSGDVVGTYRDASGAMVLELRPGGEARQQVMGMTLAGTYEVDGDEVIVDIGGRQMVLQHTNGRLENGPLSLTKQE